VIKSRYDVYIIEAGRVCQRSYANGKNDTKSYSKKVNITEVFWIENCSPMPIVDFSRMLLNRQEATQKMLKIAVNIYRVGGL
jgi:hypothetical protein